MNNGPRKGTEKSTVATLEVLAGHSGDVSAPPQRAGRLGEQHDDEFIANLEEKCAGNFIKLSVAPMERATP